MKLLSLVLILSLSQIFLQKLLHFIFHTKDLSQLTYFLGLEVHHWPQGIFLNQWKYIQDLVQLAELSCTSSAETPMEMNVKYRSNEGAPLRVPLYIGNWLIVLFI